MMNLLFGTEFQVLDSTKGRHQMTKGVWFSPDHEKKVCILDIEGTDSRERGEDKTVFEQTTSLFALAIADLLIVNMWTKVP